MSVVTNVVLALAITTTQEVPCPCPDGIQGCCVLHTKEVSNTRYEPVRVKEVDDDSAHRGVSLEINHVVRSINFAYFGKEPPKFIPVKVYKEGNVNKHSRRVVGFLMIDAIELEADLFDADARKVWKVGGK